MINYAIELGHEVVAITDHESLSAHVKVEKIYRKIKKENPDFKVILGNEIYLCRNGLNANNFNRDFDRYFHFILLAKDAEGHHQLREISSRAWRRSYMARGMRRVPTYYQDLIDIIGENPGHVIGSTACLGGALATQLCRARDNCDPVLEEKIIIWCQQMKRIFGEGNFYLEMQPSAGADQRYVNKKILELSEKLDIPYIITTDSHYLKKEDGKIHKAYLNSQNGDREVDSFYATTYMMSTEELESYMELTREELDVAYENIRGIKAKCEDYTLMKPLRIPELPWKKSKCEDVPDYFIEKIPYYQTFIDSDFEGDHLLVKIITDAILSDKRLQNQETYDEINECLKMTWISSEVNKTHWSSYYLNLQRIIDECWNAGTLVGCGRGSGVGFILLYLLGITQINPMWETTKTKRWRLTREGSKVSYLW